MDNEDYNDDYLDAFQYLMGGLHSDMEWDEDEEYPPMIGLSKFIEEEVVRLADPYFYVGVDFGYEPTQVECDHKWVPYQGLNSKFEFCEKCDVKK
jgi:hypothetical protein